MKVNTVNDYLHEARRKSQFATSLNFDKILNIDCVFGIWCFNIAVDTFNKLHIFIQI